MLVMKNVLNIALENQKLVREYLRGEISREEVEKNGVEFWDPRKLNYVCDNNRHLVCIPYSIENLHRMADELKIKRCWFHNDHYDIPKRRISEIKSLCTVVSSKEIVDIIRTRNS